MTVYYLLILMPLIFTLVGLGRTRIKHYSSDLSSENFAIKKDFCILSFFIIFALLLFLRDVSCGIDLKNYQSMFTNVSHMSFPEVYRNYSEETWYYLINKVISFFGDFRLFLIVCAIISLLPIAIFYIRETKLSYLTIVLFVTAAPFSMYFSGLRQTLAMAFAVPIWYCAKNKKLILNFILVFLATLFHSSALALLLIYPIYYVKITRRWLIFVIPSMILGFVYRKELFTLGIELTLDRYAEQYSGIFDTGGYTMLVLLVLFAVFSYAILDEKRADRDTLALRNMLLVMVFIQFFATISTIAMRLNYYLLIFVPVLIPKVIFYARSEYQILARQAATIMCIFFSLYFIINGYTGDDILHIYPYVPFWKG